MNMKPIFAAVLLAAVALTAFSSCSSPGGTTTTISNPTNPSNPMPTPKPNEDPLIKNPVVSYVAQNLTDFAFNQAQAYVNNYLFGPKSAKRNAPTMEQDIEKTVAEAKAKFPKEPDTKIRAVVKRQYSVALERKRG